MYIYVANKQLICLLTHAFRKIYCKKLKNKTTIDIEKKV